MKTTLYSLLAAAACGMALGQTAYTTPVGYETLSLNAGFNYCGLRLQSSVTVAGVLTGVTGDPSPKTISDSSKDFQALLDSGTKYILEIMPSGFVQIIDGSAAISNATIVTPDNLLAAGVATGNTYSIRPAATLVSTFGAVPTILATGNGGFGSADQLYIPDENALLKRYYYDVYGQYEPEEGPPGFVNPGPGWYLINGDNTTTKVSNPSAITMPYMDGFLFGAASPKQMTVSGTLKTSKTVQVFTPGFNYVGSVNPAGATLANAFGADPTELAEGNGGFGSADQLYVVDSAGVLKRYYYDVYGQYEPEEGPPGFVNPGPGWYLINGDNTTTKVADPSAISMSSGYLFGAASAKMVTVGAPTSYSNL